MSDIKKKVDDEWKKKAQEDKEKLETVKEELEAAADEPLPPPTFLHVLSRLDLEARLGLGEIKHPSTQKATRDLPSAQYAIDTLAVLQEKTKGNLDHQEDIALQNLLTELRFKFVEAKRAAAEPKSPISA